MISEPIHVTDASFEQAVMKSELPVVVDFWAPWCGPCKMLAPILDQAAKEYAGKIIVAKMNIDDEGETAVSLGIQSIPTMLFIRNGEIVNKTVGSKPLDQVYELIDELLA